jgi:hypothetical protein
VSTPGALAAHSRPAGQGFTVGGLPKWRGGMKVAEAGRLDGARRQRSGQWPMAAPVSFYGTWEGI